MMDRVVIAFLTGSAVFGALLFDELSDVPDHPAALPTPARSGAALAAPAAPRQRAEELVQTSLAQPLFSTTRRPPDQSTAGRASDPELPNIRLTGIVIEPEHHLAIFAMPGGKPLARVEGETINEWRLESVGPNQVSLSGPTGITILEPKSDPNLARPREAAQRAVVSAQPAAQGGVRPPQVAPAKPSNRATIPGAGAVPRPNPARQP